MSRVLFTAILGWLLALVMIVAACGLDDGLLSVLEQVGPRGGRTGEQADSTEGHPLPPTMKPGYSWDLIKPARHKGDR